jgi:hypothetical protein
LSGVKVRFPRWVFFNKRLSPHHFNMWIFFFSDRFDLCLVRREPVGLEYTPRRVRRKPEKPRLQIGQERKKEKWVNRGRYTTRTSNSDIPE